MVDIVAKDVMGTAHVNAAVAATKMDSWLRSDVDIRPTMSELDRVIFLMNKSLGDLMLVHHMLSDDWGEPTTYVGQWDRET
jgi:hypothetical protein